MKLVVLGLSLSSSWGNGHATTYRGLLKALASRGHDVLFLERDVPWYAAHRDLCSPDFCRLAFYHDLADMERWRPEIAAAEAVMVGSYVPDGVLVGEHVLRWANGMTAFYDIDTPVTLSALDRGEPTYIAVGQIPRYDLYLSFTGGPTLDRLRRDYGARSPHPFYCSVDAEAYRPQCVPWQWDLSYLGTYSDDRQAALELLLIEAARRAPELRFAVAGSLYPASIAWPANVEYLEHVPPSAHPVFYGASRYTLNITRQAMMAAGYSPSVRLFEAAACATAIISDRWPGIDMLFGPEQVAVADGTQDVLRILSGPDHVRATLAAGARQQILAAHTAAHRAAQFEALCHAPSHSPAMTA